MRRVLCGHTFDVALLKENQEIKDGTAAQLRRGDSVGGIITAALVMNYLWPDRVEKHVTN